MVCLPNGEECFWICLVISTEYRRCVARTMLPQDVRLSARPSVHQMELQYNCDVAYRSIHLSNVAVQENYVNGKRSDKIPDNNFMTSDQLKDYLW